MSNSDVVLDVFATDQTSEVIVVDSNFQVLARGIQSVQLKVPPGIYRAKARVGDQVNEELFSVEPDEPGGYKAVHVAALEFASPIPLQGTSTSREFHQDAIRSAAHIGGNTAQLGQGAALVIFLRDPSKIYFSLAAAELENYKNNFHGFTLGRLDGSESHPLEEIGRLAHEQGFLIVSASIDPGTYVLSHLGYGKERLCLPLVIPPGWSLQVFVSMVPTVENPAVVRPDFDAAAMVFDRPDAEFFPERPDLRVLEVARQALARGHNVIDSNTMNVLLAGKFQNPMMGLFAAHLLLLSKKPDLDLVQLVITNTGNLIGPNYPDLLILSWKLGQLRSPSDAPDSSALIRSMKEPPMLQLSWHYFMEAYRGLADKAMLDKGLSKLPSQLVASSVWLSWLDGASSQTVSDVVQEDEYLNAAQIEFDLATAEASRKPSTDAPQDAGSGAPLPDISVGPMAGNTKIDLNVDLDSIRNAIRVGTRNILERGGLDTGPLRIELPKTGTRGTLRIELPTLGGKKRKIRIQVRQPKSKETELPKIDTTLLQEELEKAMALLQEKREKARSSDFNLQNIDIQEASRILISLVMQVDWKSVVGQLKSLALSRSGDEPQQILTPLQRQLLLMLKGAREQYEDEGDLSLDAAMHRLKIADVPLYAIVKDLYLLFLVAAKTNKVQFAGIAKAIVQASNE